MAGTKTGTPSIWKHSRKIVSLYQTLGASDLETKLGADFKACVVALVNCAIAIMATDDFVLQIDRTLPTGPEDIPPA